MEELSRQEHARLGLVPGVDAAGPLAIVDPNPNFQPITDRFGRSYPDACPYLPEDRQGIHVYKHPSMILAEDPALAAVVDRHRFLRRTGSRLTLEDYRKESNFVIEGLEIMEQAATRKAQAQAREDPPSG